MSTDVLVVGAGPTGLTTAIELARRGIGVRVIDTAIEPTTETRALGVQARTLELFERLQIADAAVQAGLPVAEFNVFSENKRFLHLSLRQLETAYPYLLMLRQPQVEALLSKRLNDFGVTVERGVELRTLTQHPDSVVAELRHHDNRIEQARTPWLVGCDGAHSVVRRQLDIPFLGKAFEENFAVADVHLEWSLPYNIFYAFLNRGNFVAYFPMPGDLHRLTVAYPPGRAPTGEVTFAELTSALSRCAPPGTRIGDVTYAGRFQINQRKVARHSAGRVFLAGDAAHIHSVVGGQGMNTGIQDAFNLGWKLAAVIDGHADHRLLDTYGRERGSVAARLVKGTRRATRMTLLRNPVATAARRNIAPLLTPSPVVQHTLARALSQLDVSYRDSSGGSSGSRLAVGDRYPDSAILHPSKYTLLISGAEPPGLAEVLDGHAELFEIRGVDADAHHPDGLTLIRPDGYVAMLGGDTTQLNRYLADMFTQPSYERKTT
jgi:2-polyprenyl-6-methoxyphenol hydroxylase-like FAD-dependent oxidoreductase